MSATQRRVRGALLLAAVLAIPGCAGMTLGDVLGGMGMPGSGGRVQGEVSYVDQRSREIEVRSGWGQATRVEYDSNTEVVYQNRRYSVQDLERGDVVSMQVQQARNGQLYTDRIYVERSAQQGSGGSYPGDYDDDASGRVERYEGRVSQVDTQRGWFGLQARDGRDYRVTLPYNPSSTLLSQFRRLRRGDSVRLDGERLNGGRIEVVRFR